MPRSTAVVERGHPGCEQSSSLNHSIARSPRTSSVLGAPCPQTKKNL